MQTTMKFHEMSLADLNAELDAAGFKKQYSSIRHARNAVRKAYDKGHITYGGDGDFIDEDAIRVQEEMERPATKKEKTKKVDRVWEMESDHPMTGKEVFSKVGKHIITQVGHYQDDPDTTMVILSDPKESVVKLSSVRTSAVNANYRDRYNVFKEQKTPGGKPSIGVDDEVTRALFGKTIDQLAEIAAENGIDFSRWDNLNPGMKRMCLGNTLRSKVSKNLKVTVLGQTLIPGADEDFEDREEFEEATSA